MMKTIKQVIKKSLGMVGITVGKTYWVQSKKWMLYQVREKGVDLTKGLGYEIDSDIKKCKVYPQQSKEIDLTIEKLLDDKKYTFMNMLIVTNPYQYAPLCAMAIFGTKKDCKVSVTVFGKTEDTNISYTLDKTRRHRVPILGLYEGMENKVEICLLDDKDNVLKRKEVIIRTEEMKGVNGELEIIKEPSVTDYCYGLTLVYGGNNGVYPYAFDKNGDRRFIFSMVPKSYGFQPMKNGRYLFLAKKATRETCHNPSGLQVYEIDQLGRIHRIYNIEAGSHHDYCELEDGNLVVASNAFDGTYEDAVLEIDRKTGQVVNEVNIKDYVDKKFIDSSDWAHLNSLQYDKENKTVIVSCRNLHSVLKIDWGNKKLLWILCDPTVWKGTPQEDKVLKPTGDMQWFYHQHAAYYVDFPKDHQSVGKLILFDNHNCKRRAVETYDEIKDKSFVRIYEIDENKNTVSLIKSFDSDRSGIRSDAFWEQEENRVLAMNGRIWKKVVKEEQVTDENGQTVTKTKTDKIAVGSVIEYDYDSGAVLNKFKMNFGFYRARKFKFQPQMMTEPMDMDDAYYIGELHGIEKCTPPDVSNAIKVSDIDTEHATSEEKGILDISAEIEQNILYIRHQDHLLQALYFVGENQSYIRDLSYSKQERMEYFAGIKIYDPIPLDMMEKDHYTVYFKKDMKLYQSDISFQKK